MKPHKHAEVIKAWADGAVIQFKEDCGLWQDTSLTGPNWYECIEYRVKHINQALLDAHAKGATIQFRNSDEEWIDVEPPLWRQEIKYRIKPEFKHNRLFYVSVMENEGPFFTLVKDLNSANVKFTFNFETNELISAEKI